MKSQEGRVEKKFKTSHIELHTVSHKSIKSHKFLLKKNFHTDAFFKGPATSSLSLVGEFLTWLRSGFC